MKYLHLILFLLFIAIHNKQIDQWQQGFDHFEKATDQNKIEYHTSKIEYIRKMDHIPKIVLMIDHIEFHNKFECFFSVHTADITELGFKIRYSLGPELKKIKVRWLAINDPLIEVQHLKYALSDLTDITFGTGSRYVQLPVKFQTAYHRDLDVVLFLSGIKISTSNPFSIELQVKDITSTGFNLEAKTRTQSHVKYLEIYMIGSSDQMNIVDTDFALANTRNYFEDKSIRGIRHQEFKVEVENDSQKHFVAHGITGFDVDSNSQYTELGFSHSFIKDKKYRVSYGPFGNTSAHAMQISVLIHPHLMMKQQSLKGQRANKHNKNINIRQNKKKNQHKKQKHHQD